VNTTRLYTPVRISREFVRVFLVGDDRGSAARGDLPRPYDFALVLYSTDTADDAIIVVADFITIALSVAIMDLAGLFT
jgi:hypothetical protein